MVTLNVSGVTKGFTVSRKILTNDEGSGLEAFFSGRHEITKVDGNLFVDRDHDIFKLLISYLRNDKLELDIQDPVKK